MHSQNSQNPSGFSLMEIIIALGVISILFGTVAPLLVKFNEAMERKFTLSEMQDIQRGALNYFSDVGGFPPTLHDLTTNISTSSGWNGPYVNVSAGGQELIDAWGESYAFNIYIGTQTVVGATSNVYATQRFVLYSKGPDLSANPSADNITMEVTSEDVKQTLITETVKRLGIVMELAQKLQGPSSNVYATLDLVVGTTENCPSLSPDTANNATEITFFSQVAADNGYILSEFYKYDLWGNPFLWNDQLNQFYSMGANRFDDTCNNNRITEGDIKGQLDW